MGLQPTDTREKNYTAISLRLWERIALALTKDSSPQLGVVDTRRASVERNQWLPIEVSQQEGDRRTVHLCKHSTHKEGESRTCTTACTTNMRRRVSPQPDPWSSADPEPLQSAERCSSQQLPLAPRHLLQRPAWAKTGCQSDPLSCN